MHYKKKGMLGGSGYFSAAVLLVAVLSVVALSWGPLTGMLTSSAGTHTQLTIWDVTEEKGGSLVRKSGQNVTFYANFTNITDGAPMRPEPDVVFCNITFNITGSWLGPYNMSFDSTTGLYWYNKTFNWKGTFDFNVSCRSNATYSNEWLNASDNYTITNSYPVISPKPLDPVACYEDSCGNYDFSANCTDADANDELDYSRDSDTYFQCFYINSDTGVVSLSACDTDTEADGATNYVMRLICTDSSDKSDIVDQTYNIYPVNDVPIILVCRGESAYENVEYICDINATDEENDVPFNFTANYTFLNINESTGIINFTANNSIAGYNYSINITVNDSRGGFNWTTMWLEIINVNDPPEFTYVCNSSRNVTENELFECWLNATDIDSSSLIFYTNTSWFQLDSTGKGISPPVSPNASSRVSFTGNDTMIGNHSILVTVEDDSGVGASARIPFEAINVPDRPMFNNIGNATSLTTWAYIAFNFTVTGWDDDMYWNGSEHINFTNNNTGLFNMTALNRTDGKISFISDASDAGEHMVLITATDGTGQVNHTVLNLTIYDNRPPHFVNLFMVNTTVYDGNEYYYDLSDNVTDINGDNIFFTDNTTLFDINLTTGIINFTADDSVVGNHSVLVTLTDMHGANNHTNITFQVLNVNDPPTLQFNNWTMYEDSAFHLEMYSYVSDQDKSIPSSVFNDTFTFNASNASNVNQSMMDFFNMTTGGTVWFTPLQANIGNYSMNISVVDSGGEKDWQIVNVSILAVNDPPMFTYLCNSTRIAEEATEFTCWINATDPDSSTLAFSSNTTFFDIDTSAKPINATDPSAGSLANFTPSNNDVGNHSILITVTDDGSESTSARFTFEVTDINTEPIIDWWKWVIPGNMSTSATNATTNFTVYENQTIQFYHTSHDPDPSDNLDYYWWKNGTTNGTTANYTYWVPFDGNVNASFNFTLLVQDRLAAADRQEWKVYTVNVNRAPVLFENISDLSWPEDTSTTLNLSNHFTDPDGDNMSFNYTLSYECRQITCMSISFSGREGNYIATFTPATNWFGFANVTITANDTDYNTSSNSFRLNVTYVYQPPTYIYISTPSGGTSGSTGSVKIASLRMFAKNFVTLIPLKRMAVPIVLKNTGKTTLNAINLTINVDTKNIELTLQNTSISKLETGSNVTTNLTIDIVNESIGVYEIRIDANVTSPELNESLYLRFETAPTNATKVETKILFARDLFQENPECMELMEMILQAEKHLQGGNITQATQLTELALNNCRDLIKYQGPTGSTPPTDKPLIVNLQPIDFIIILVLFIIAWIIVRTVLNRKSKKKYIEMFSKPQPEKKVELPPAVPADGGPKESKKPDKENPGGESPDVF